MNRPTTIAIAASATSLLLALVVLLTIAPDDLRAGVVAAFTLLAAAGTAAAALAAWRSASASSAAAQDARRALALHNRNLMQVSLWPDYGVAGNEWVWIVTSPQESGSDSPFSRDVDFEWTVKGRTHREHRSVLAPTDIWKVRAQVEGDVSHETIHTQITGARITWHDAHRISAWKAIVEVAPSGLLHGQYAPHGRADTWDDRPWGATYCANVYTGPPEIVS